MTQPAWEIWSVIVGLGVGTYLLRLSFLGLLGGRQLPSWMLRLLRYTSVAVLPGLVAPLVLWPQATGGEIDPARLIAAGAALAVGYFTRHVVYAMLGGMVTLYLMTFLLH
ncbi:MAG: AzlD domain-containing protein [Gammaproteobacteria bacterium]|nr:AzlD domain-containing protein [Gammaproteobacteria bacterium]